MKTLLSLILLAVLVEPATFAQSTPFTQDPFSATFHGPVLAKTYGHPGEDTTNEYYSSANKIYQAVTIRTISHNILVNYNSADFYLVHECEGAAGQNCALQTSVEYLSHTLINGHPSSYGYLTEDFGGVKYTERLLVVIVDARTVIRFLQIAPAADPDTDRTQWNDFRGSLKFLR